MWQPKDFRNTSPTRNVSPTRKDTLGKLPIGDVRIETPTAFGLHDIFDGARVSAKTPTIVKTQGGLSHEYRTQHPKPIGSRQQPLMLSKKPRDVPKRDNPQQHEPVYEIKQHANPKPLEEKFPPHFYAICKLYGAVQNLSDVEAILNKIPVPKHKKASLDTILSLEALHEIQQWFHDARASLQTRGISTEGIEAWGNDNITRLPCSSKISEAFIAYKQLIELIARINKYINDTNAAHIDQSSFVLFAGAPILPGLHSARAILKPGLYQVFTKVATSKIIIESGQKKTVENPGNMPVLAINVLEGRGVEMNNDVLCVREQVAITMTISKTLSTDLSRIWMRLDEM